MTSSGGDGSQAIGQSATQANYVAAVGDIDDPVLHNQYELFAAVMDVPASALERFDTAFEGPHEHLGERVVSAYLEAWENTAGQVEGTETPELPEPAPCA